MSKPKALTEYPEIIKQWDFEKNKVEPTKLTAGSGLIVWWICDIGHSWKSEIKSRIRGTGCPFCAGKKALEGFNDLNTCNPKLAEEWDYSKNTLTPSQVTCGSKKQAWWNCDKGHSWLSDIGSRSKGSGCPVCSGRTALTGFNDLQTLRPDLSKEWDYEKNKGIPSHFTLGSNKLVWWKCINGHSWQTAICNRSNKKTGTGCPYCAGKAVITGVNDLQTLNPVLALEWDYTKNKISPTDVKTMSNKEVWWVCGKGHSWKVAVQLRSKGCGCPYCAGKRVLKGFNDLQTLSPNLAQEWDFEKNKLLPSQVTIGSGKKVWWKCNKGHSWETKVVYRKYGYNCPICSRGSTRMVSGKKMPLNERIITEWDYQKNDLAPSEVTAGSGISVWSKCEHGHSWRTRISSLQKSKGCPYCNGKLVFTGFNDLQTVNPKLVKEWDWEKNTIKPEQILIGSTKPVWWKCKKGHSWKCSVTKRNADNYGCPYCSGQRVLEGFNDLKSCNPTLASQWDYDKNELLPTQVTSGSSKTAWWKCDKGHSWQAQINGRNVGRDCPYCVGRYVLAGFNDLQTLMPELACEWDYEKNVLKPSEVTMSSSLTAWWKCSKGHSWKTHVQNRSGLGCGCPYCSGLMVLTGFNDLETVSIGLACEWDYEKNTLAPSQVSAGSSESFWWKCNKGHSWKASVSSRNRIGCGCPYCFGRVPYIPRCVK